MYTVTIKEPVVYSTFGCSLPVTMYNPRVVLKERHKFDQVLPPCVVELGEGEGGLGEGRGKGRGREERGTEERGRKRGRERREERGRERKERKGREGEEGKGGRGREGRERKGGKGAGGGKGEKEGGKTGNMGLTWSCLPRPGKKTSHQSTEKKEIGYSVT